MSTPGKVLISLEDITVRLRGEVLLENINFEVKAGEHWALVGDQEKERSTLLETIAGKMPVTAGKATYPFLEKFQQENPVQYPASSWHNPISLVSSRHNFGSLSRTETLFYQQRYNASAAEDAPTVQEYLEEIKSYTDNPFWTFEKTVVALKLQDLLNKRLIKLSNGETRRVLLAEGLLQNPAVLLLENPLVGLDVRTRQEFNHLVTTIARSGVTIIMSTSSSEIPDAITHVAEWNKENRIQVMPKHTFSSIEKEQESRSLDETEVQALLNTTNLPAFDNIIRMEDVTVKYGDKIVLNDINWTVKQGERWALLGHNGAGKSTLLSLINGDNPQAYANSITLFDRKRGSGESIWDIKQHIGFVSPELFQYFPGSQSCEHVIESGFHDAVGLQRESSPANQAVVKRWMKVLHIENLAGKQFRSVSVSNQRLCLLARALVKNPTLLILDEPCQGFDVTQQEHFKSLIETICGSSNLTLIYVSHYQHEIPNSVSKVMHLEKGKATIEEL